MKHAFSLSFFIRRRLLLCTVIGIGHRNSTMAFACLGSRTIDLLKSIRFSALGLVH